MSTVLSINRLRVVNYPNDHRPEHVHVVGSRCEAVFLLKRPHGTPVLRDNFGFTIKQIDMIIDALATELRTLSLA